jgi:hypothetical protein
MKRKIPLEVLLALLVFSLVIPAAAQETSSQSKQGGAMMSPQGKARTFTGEIWDSDCAKMGSHEQMMKGEGSKNAKECTLSCVSGMGSKFVLYDQSKKAIYQLSDQDKPKEYAGQRVTVTGTYDSASKTIQVQSIEPAS